ncbi:unnamed protein product [Ectocarpus sp. 4 AP-2014]
MMAQQQAVSGAGERAAGGGSGGSGGRAGGGSSPGVGGPSLVQWSPVYSNYFAYSSGRERSGIDLYRVSWSVPGGDAELPGLRGSVNDRRPSGGDQQQQQQVQQGTYRAGSMTFHDPSAPEGGGGSTIAGLSLAAATGVMDPRDPSSAAAAAAGVATPATVPTVATAGAADAARVRRLASGSGGGGAAAGGGGDGGSSAAFSSGGGGGGSADVFGNVPGPENPFAGAGPEYHHHLKQQLPAEGAVGGVVAGVGGSAAAVASAAASRGGAGVGSNAQPSYGGTGGVSGGYGNPFAGVDGGGAQGAAGGGFSQQQQPQQQNMPFRAGVAAVVAPALGGGGGGVADGGVAGGSGGGEFAGYPLGPRKASSAYSEQGNARSVMAATSAVAATGSTKREWKYHLEGRSRRWKKQKDGHVTCMSWFPHSETVGGDGMGTGDADIRMLAVGYSSGKGVVRCRHGGRKFRLAQSCCCNYRRGVCFFAVLVLITPGGNNASPRQH